MYWNYYHQKQCWLRPVVPSIVFGGIFTAMDVVAYRHPFSAQTVMLYMGGIYVYNIVQCPMEAVLTNNGKPSAWHNVAAGGMLGYIGVSRGVL